MSLIDLASLVLAPTATKEGKVYSAIPDTGDGDMTFTRGSAATRVNSAGLIEKERGNLLLQSNAFDTTWASINTNQTGGQAGYDGTNDAWLITKSAALGRVQQSIATGGVQTLSVYAKAGSLNWLRLQMTTSNTFDMYYDLQNGVLGSSQINAPIDATITSIGNGWYRCSITADETLINVRIYPADDDEDLSGTSGNILIQDAMLNAGLVAQSYIPTTTSAVYEGITDDVPRVDYSGGGCPSLLLEGQRSNLIPHSEYFQEHTLIGVTTSENAEISPEGVSNGTEIIESSGYGEHTGYVDVSCTTSTDYTISIFAKANTRDYFFLRFGGANSVFTNSYAWFNLSNGTTGTIESGITADIEDFGNGWYRLIATRTSAATATGRFFWGLADSNGSTAYTGNGSSSAYTYGFQAEAGSYSTSYIPTYSVSSTRVADSCSKTGISELIGQSEGTVFVDFDYNQPSSDSNGRLLQVYDTTDTTNSILPLIFGDGADVNRFQLTAFSASTASIPIPSSASTVVPFGRQKFAIAYNAGVYTVYRNGSLFASGSGYAPVSLTAIDLGSSSFSTRHLGNPINQALLFKTRLTNDELADLTKL